VIRFAAAALALAAGVLPAPAADWVLQTIPAAGPVKAIDVSGTEPVISIGGGWFRVFGDETRLRLVATAGPSQMPRPPGALPDGQIARGRLSVARAWLAEPTDRYRHGVLGDAIEAASLVVERPDGRRDTVQLDGDAVFEDLFPRIADLGGADREAIVVVKSYLDRGAALAVVGERDGRFAVIAETPASGAPNRWLNPAGFADFDGDGAPDIALVRMPHALGTLELWSWRNGRIEKALTLPDFSNHVAGSRALRMSAVADFDGDGKADLAIPSFDRRTLRIVSFAGEPRDIARIALPARAATDFAILKDETGRVAVLLALENGALVLARRPAR
jgi:hypothetical protein